MKYGIIGYSGFVGSNLTRQHPFDYKYNSKNIRDIEGKEIGLLILAAPSASMWVANQDPDGDKKIIDGILENISKSKTKRIVYLSTVAVYDKTSSVNEDSEIDGDKITAYGRNRLYLEKEILHNYPGSLIVRLPGLFGTGLKKNYIYDMKETGESPWTNENSVYQFYNLENAWKDISLALKNGLKTLNITSEPVSVKEVARECFGKDFTNKKEAPLFNYDIKTIYDEIFGGKEGYIYSKKDILFDIKRFIGSEMK